MDISELKPKFLVSRQRQYLGFKLRGNQLVLGQKLNRISSEIKEPEVPILILKKVEIVVNSRRRKMNFCLVGEEFWMVF